MTGLLWFLTGALLAIVGLVGTIRVMNRCEWCKRRTGRQLRNGGRICDDCRRKLRRDLEVN